MLENILHNSGTSAVMVGDSKRREQADVNGLHIASGLKDVIEGKSYRALSTELLFVAAFTDRSRAMNQSFPMT